MAYQLFNLPPQQPLSAAGRVLPGAKLYFYETGTTNAAPVYTTSALNVAHSQPLVADSGGRFATVYLDPTVEYKATVTDSADALLYTVDPVNDQLLSGAIIGEYLYPRTAAEIAAAVTPTDYAFPPFNVRRYGAALDGPTDDTDAFNDAITVANTAGGGAVTFDGPTSVLNLTLKDKVSIVGIGNPLMTITPAAASDVAISAIGTVGTSVALDANATIGAYEVSVASATGLAVGDYVLIRDQNFVFSTSGQNQEINKIIDIAGGTITLQSGLIGSYATASSASIDVLSPISGFVLEGFRIQIAAGSDGGGIKMQYCVGFTVRELDITAPAAWPGIRLTTCGFGRVESNRINAGQGSVAGGGSGLSIDLNDTCQHILIHSNIIEWYNQVEIAMRSRYISFCDNICRHSVDTGVNTHGNNCSHVIIARNLFDACELYAVAVGNSTARTHDEFITVTDNIITNCGEHGISVASKTTDHNINVKIARNQVRGVALIGSSSVVGIRAVFTDDLEITDNIVDCTTIVNNPTSGISVIECSRSRVAGNRVREVASGTGVNMTTCEDFVVESNYFDNISSSNVATATSTGTALVRFNTADDSSVSIDSGAKNFGNSWNANPVVLEGSKTYNPGLFSDGAGGTTTVTVTGAALGDFAEASGSIDYQGVLVTAWVSAADTVSVRFQNETGGNVTINSHTLRVRVRKA